MDRRFSRAGPAAHRRVESEEALSRYVGVRPGPAPEVADARTALALVRTEMAAAGPHPALR